MVSCYALLCVVGKWSGAPPLDHVYLLATVFLEERLPTVFYTSLGSVCLLYGARCERSVANPVDACCQKECATLLFFSTPYSSNGFLFIYVVAAGRFVLAYVSMRCASRCACMAVFVGGSRMCTHMVGRSVVRLVLRPFSFSSFSLFLLLLPLSSSLPQPVISLNPPFLLAKI